MGVGGTCSPGPQGNKATGETPGETLGRSQDREGTGHGGGLSQQSQWSSSTGGVELGSGHRGGTEQRVVVGEGGHGWLLFFFCFVFIMYLLARQMRLPKRPRALRRL